MSTSTRSRRSKGGRVDTTAGSDTPASQASTVAGMDASHKSSRSNKTAASSRRSTRTRHSTARSTARPDSTDMEVSFHTVDQTGSHHAHSRHDSRHSQSGISATSSTAYRIDTLESDMQIVREDVTGIKGEVQGMNQKLMKIMEFMQPVHIPKAAGGIGSGTSPTPTQHPAPLTIAQVDTQPHTQPGMGLPPPTVLKSLPQHQDFVEAQLRREELQHQPTEGKLHFVSDILAPKALVKPYMFLEKSGMSTLKQKLEHRHLMNKDEYLTAFLALLKKKAAYDLDDYDYLFAHLHNVSTDGLSRPWRDVLRWSQLMFDKVEARELSWKDRVDMQDERVRISMTGGGDETTSKVKGSSSNSSVACPEFNGERGCKHRHDHMDGSVKSLHVCAYCLSKGKRLHHTVTACQNKVRDAPPPAWPSNNGPRGGVTPDVYQPPAKN